MLVLSRKEGQSIMIGNVRVYVTKITPHRVRLGVEAPDTVRIRRAEVVDKKGDQHDQ